MKVYIASLGMAALIAASCNDAATDTTTTSGDTAASATTAPATEAAAPAGSAFEKEVSYKDYKFKLTSPGTATNNSFTLTPSGYTASNEAVTKTLGNGEMVSDIKIGEIDSDDKPEVMVVTKQAENEIGFPYIFSSNNGASVSEVSTEGIDDDTKKDYDGHDEFNFVEGTFVHLFPVSKDGKATGKTHQVQYKLKAGEAMKKLVKDKEMDY